MIYAAARWLSIEGVLNHDRLGAQLALRAATQDLLRDLEGRRRRGDLQVRDWSAKRGPGRSGRFRRARLLTGVAATTTSATRRTCLPSCAA